MDRAHPAASDDNRPDPDPDPIGAEFNFAPFEIVMAESLSI
jgi:hypothetical protein